MDSELRELLRARAEHVEVDPAIPVAVLRRARRRRAATVGATGLVLAGLLAGGIVVGRALVDMTDLDDQAGRVGRAWRGVWPQDTRPEAVAAQAAADAGDREFAWQRNVEEVATRYAEEVLGWERVRYVEPPAPDRVEEAGPLKMHVAACPAIEVFSRPSCTRQATLTVERLVRRDRTGIWVVTDVEQLWAGIWPQTTRESAEAAQAAADAGDPDFTWQLDAEAFVERYAGEELGWSRVYYAEPIGPIIEAAGPGGPMSVEIGDCPKVTDGCDHWAGLDMERLLRRGDTGIWALTAVGFDPIEDAPGPSELRSFVADFMEARIRESGAERFVSPLALQRYESGEILLGLYNPVSSPFWTYHEVTRMRQLGPSTHEVTILVLTETSYPPDLSWFRESLVIGPGENTEGDHLPLVVREATGDAEGSFATPFVVRRFVDKFMAARLAGTSAEGFLTDHARARYSSGEGGLSLYGLSEAHDSRFEIRSVEKVEAGTYKVVVFVHEERTSGPDRPDYLETLTVGSGNDVDGNPRFVVVRDVTGNDA